MAIECMDNNGSFINEQHVPTLAPVSPVDSKPAAHVAVAANAPALRTRFDTVTTYPVMSAGAVQTTEAQPLRL